MFGKVINRYTGEKGNAYAGSDSIRVYVIDDDGSIGDRFEYTDIGEFANVWEFQRATKLLSDSVIDFIKHFLMINGIGLNEVKSVVFNLHDKWVGVTFDGSFKCVADNIELNSDLIDYTLIEDEKEYTLPELGII